MLNKQKIRYKKTKKLF